MNKMTLNSEQERLGACRLGEDKHKGGLSVHYLIN
mgnify:FL=1